MVDPPPRRSGRRGAGFVPPWLSPPSPSLTLDEALTERGYIPPNLQTRMICGLVSPYDPLPEGALEQAKRNLDERFAYVGTTERFNEFLALLNLELGWPTVAYRRSNANPKRPKQSDLPPETLRLVEERNELDQELYAHAASILDRSLSRHGAALGDEAEVLRLAEQRRRSGETPDPRSLPLDARVEMALKEGAARLRPDPGQAGEEQGAVPARAEAVVEVARDDEPPVRPARGVPPRSPGSTPTGSSALPHSPTSAG